MFRAVLVAMILVCTASLLLSGAARAVGIALERGDVIAFTSNTADGYANVSLLDVNRRTSLDLTPRLTQERFIAWSPDGMRFAVSQEDQPPVGLQNHTLVVSAFDGRVEREGSTGRYGAFSPDGRWLAYTRMVDASVGHLMLIDLETGRRSRLSRHWITGGAPVWSTDGTAVLIGARLSSEPYQIHRFPMDGSDPTILTDYVGNNYDPKYSPDGRYLLFQSAQRRALSVMVMPVDGSAPPRSVTAGDGFCELTAWSPDSTRVAAVCQGVYGRFGRALFLAYIDSREVDFLAANVRAIQLQWTRDGESILYAGEDGMLYRIAAPTIPIEGTDAPRPIPEPVMHLYSYTSETYMPLGVRP